MMETSRIESIEPQQHPSVVELMNQDLFYDAKIRDGSFSDPYEVKYFKLQKKCESIKLQNYRLINHICQINKLVRKAKKQNAAILTKLEEQNPEMRNQLNNFHLMEPLWKSSQSKFENSMKHPSNSLSEPPSTTSEDMHSSATSASSKRMKYNATNDFSPQDCYMYSFNGMKTFEAMETTMQLERL